MISFAGCLLAFADRAARFRNAHRSHTHNKRARPFPFFPVNLASFLLPVNCASTNRALADGFRRQTSNLSGGAPIEMKSGETVDCAQQGPRWRGRKFFP